MESKTPSPACIISFGFGSDEMPGRACRICFWRSPWRFYTKALYLRSEHFSFSSGSVGCVQDIYGPKTRSTYLLPWSYSPSALFKMDSLLKDLGRFCTCYLATSSSMHTWWEQNRTFHFPSQLLLSLLVFPTFLLLSIHPTFLTLSLKTVESCVDGLFIVFMFFFLICCTLKVHQLLIFLHSFLFLPFFFALLLSLPFSPTLICLWTWGKPLGLSSSTCNAFLR